jgi:hypothetical protein
MEAWWGYGDKVAHRKIPLLGPLFSRIVAEVLQLTNASECIRSSSVLATLLYITLLVVQTPKKKCFVHKMFSWGVHS